MELKGSKTEQNLETAFAGESKARVKYNIFAKAARKEGYEHIAKIFDETSDYEAEHAKVWLKLLRGDSLKSTIDNLNLAVEGENYEWTDMYAEFARQAKEEGFDQIAFLFEKIRGIEQVHEARYKKLIEEIQNESVFKKPQKVTWECAKCGYTVEIEEAPKMCPYCSHPQAFFFVKCSD